MIDHFYKNIEGWFSDLHAKEFSLIIKKIDNNANWVEVGSFKGKSLSFSIVESILQKKNINFFAVDTWDKDITGPGMAKDKDVISGKLYDAFLKNTKLLQNKFVHYRQESIIASKNFKDNSIDVLYIDAAHDYNSVYDDCNYWFPKMKASGIMIFDDYHKKWGVWQAVQDFAKEKTLKIVQKKELAFIDLKK